MKDNYGQDVLLDEYLKPVLTESGDVALTEGPQTIVQEIKIALATPLGSLFYDKDFGGELHLFKNTENTELERQLFVSEITRVINSNERVVANKTDVKISKWDETGITIEAKLYLLDEAHPSNLIIEQNSDLSLLIKDT